ncbi:MAG: gliding motility-associated C-terminal domain-containing protein [Cytophagales bacterium]|nr:gliding motility-associated C-terminal domain-containing protein [Cytophagales bacterium]
MATHLRAGEIIARVVDCQTRTYQFDIIAYTDTKSNIPFGSEGTLDFGDGTVFITSESDVSFQQMVGPEVRVNIIRITHSFSSPGEFVVSYREQNRNRDVVNMLNSVQTPFFIETKILIDPFLGCNETVRMTVPPVDFGAVGVQFLHNPGAFDPDGDSLSYELVINKKAVDADVDGYKFPNDPSFNGMVEGGGAPATYSISELGLVAWNSPGLAGEYNIAFRVHEWRKVGDRWFQLGYVTRDMQIIVKDANNDPPEITIPPDTCILAGELLEAVFEADDPNGDQVKIQAFGGPMEFEEPDNATINPPDDFQSSPGHVDFSWQTRCYQVRREPYDVIVKAIDNPQEGVTLAEFKTWKIKLVAPPPLLLRAEQQADRSIRIEWEDYSQQFVCGNNRELGVKVYRKVGAYDYTPENCNVGVPSGADYELLAEVPMEQLSYLDQNGVNYGANYCYRIVVEFLDNQGGESYASNEMCVIVEEEDSDGDYSAVITHVDVDSTDQGQGRILVRWMPPFEADQNNFPPPYRYELWRKSSEDPQADLVKIADLTDTFYVDSQLNTLDVQYFFSVKTFAENGREMALSGLASSVRADMRVNEGSITIVWEAKVPWTYLSGDYPYHYIYRNRVNESSPEQLVLIDSVLVTAQGFLYEDTGYGGEPVLLDQEYCYLVKAQGSYENDKIVAPLQNRSQMICGRVDDGRPPCKPLELAVGALNSDSDCYEALQGEDCDFDDFFNRLEWDGNITDECKDDVRHYNVYFSLDGIAQFQKVGETNQPVFVHSDISSFKGCYYIVAEDRAGNLSTPSDTVCIDNCPFYELPNLFTPNDDAFNQVFKAYENEFLSGDNNLLTENKCPRFVLSVDFKLYNRHGELIYEYIKEPGDSDKSHVVEWDGLDESGNEMPMGRYFYYLEIEYDVLDQSKRKQELKGWVDLIR